MFTKYIEEDITTIFSITNHEVKSTTIIPKDPTLRKVYRHIVKDVESVSETTMSDGVYKIRIYGVEVNRITGRCRFIYSACKLT